MIGLFRQQGRIRGNKKGETYVGSALDGKRATNQVIEINAIVIDNVTVSVTVSVIGIP
jgi:hypothetical protein